MSPEDFILLKTKSSVIDFIASCFYFSGWVAIVLAALALLSAQVMGCLGYLIVAGLWFGSHKLLNPINIAYKSKVEKAKQEQGHVVV